MDLKTLLGEDLFQSVQSKIDAVNANQADKSKHVKLVDLSEGKYVGRQKFDDQVSTLSGQITDLQNQITQRDTDMQALQTQLSTAQTDAATRVTEAQNALTALQTQYEQDKQTYQQRLDRQKYEFQVRERVNNLKFSSASAKRAFTDAAIQKSFTMDGDALLGYDEFVAQYKNDDPGAFITETPPPDPPKPDIVAPSGNTPPASATGFNFNFTGVRPHEEG